MSKLPRILLWLGLCAAPLAHAALSANANGTVTDTETGLVWDQCAYGLSGAACATGTVFEGPWPDALKQATNANAVAYKGISDWRVPSKNELESIVKIDELSPVVDSTAFPSMSMLNVFWTSTTYAPSLDSAWSVGFDNGGVNGIEKTDPGYVRLVRGGQSPAAFDGLIDTTAPITTAGPSIVSGPTHNSAGISVTINETGTGYWLLQPSSSGAPSAAQVKAAANSVALSANTAATINLSGLSPSTAYTLYFVAQDASGNLQAAPSSVGVTTTAAPPPPDSGPGSSGPSSLVQLQISTNGAGTVQRSVVGSVVGTQGSSTTVQYAYAQAVTLTAQAQLGARFTGWSGACSGLLACNLTLYSNQTVQATFTNPPPVATCRARAFTPNEELLLDAYLAYYGRPADVAGLAYWRGLVDERGDLDFTIDAFSQSIEFQRRFGQMDGSQLIANLYQQMYGRAPDAAGAAYYGAQLASGQASLVSIAIHIFDGRLGRDRVVVDNRRKVARHFVTRFEELGSAAPTLNDAQVMAGLFADVGTDATSAEVGCAQVDQLLDKKTGP